MHPAELTALSDASFDYAVPEVIEQAGPIGVLIHNASHVGLGRAEAVTPGTNHFAHTRTLSDVAHATEYDAEPYTDFGREVREVWAAIVRVGVAAAGIRPLRVHVDPTEDGATVCFKVLDQRHA